MAELDPIQSSLGAAALDAIQTDKELEITPETKRGDEGSKTTEHREIESEDEGWIQMKLDLIKELESVDVWKGVALMLAQTNCDTFIVSRIMQNKKKAISQKDQVKFSDWAMGYLEGSRDAKPAELLDIAYNSIEEMREQTIILKDTNLVLSESLKTLRNENARLVSMHDGIMGKLMEIQSSIEKKATEEKMPAAGIANRTKFVFGIGEEFIILSLKGNEWTYEGGPEEIGENIQKVLYVCSTDPLKYGPSLETMTLDNIPDLGEWEVAQTALDKFLH